MILLKKNGKQKIELLDIPSSRFFRGYKIPEFMRSHFNYPIFKEPIFLEYKDFGLKLRISEIHVDDISKSLFLVTIIVGYIKL